MTHVTIDRDAIKQLFAEMQKSFDSNGPLRVAVEALIPDRLGAAATAPGAIDDSDRQRCQRARIVPPQGSGTFSE